VSTAVEIAADFERVDELLVTATAAAPAVALLTAGAADATADRIDLEAADDDIAELVLRWARS
jgi:hypothetical protein